MKIREVSEGEWRSFSARFAAETAAERRRLEDAERQLRQAGSSALDAVTTERLLARALGPEAGGAVVGTTAAPGLRSGGHRSGWNWSGWRWAGLSVAAAGLLVTLTVRLWPSERNPRDDLSLRDAFVVIAEPGRDVEARRGVLVKLFGLARDALKTLRESAALDQTPAAQAASDGLDHLRRVLDGTAPSLALRGADLDSADADLPLLAALARTAGDRSSARLDAVREIVAITSQVLVALDAVAPDLAGEAGEIRDRLARMLSVR